MSKKSYLKIAILLCSILFITSSTSASIILQKSNIVLPNTQAIADIPVWDIGDEWIYNMEINGDQESFLSFDLSIENLKMKVTEITESSNILTLTVPRGFISGSGTVDLDVMQLSGNIKDTRLEGYMEINKDTLETIYGEFIIDGYIDKVVDIPFEIEANLSFYKEDFNETSFSTIQFPLEINKQWINPFTYVVVPLQVNLLPEPAFIYTFVEEQTITCEGWDVIQSSQKEYDALKITGDIGGSIWYAIAAGNTIKANYQDIALGNDFFINRLTMNLQSTTYEITSNAPVKPTMPAGSSNLVVGEIGEYETSSTDPDGDFIKYIFDWGDGTITGSDFYPSGEDVAVSKQWLSKGTYEVKVKARDIYGMESPWSDSLLVTVQNIDPNKPSTPQGPTEGKIESSYDYSTSSTDPDDHRIRYGWDWDGNQQVDEWTNYYDSGQEVITSHVWYEEGTYQIRVKAEDEYGAMSDWSEPLSVVMPKSKYLFDSPLLHIFIKSLVEKYPFLITLFFK